MQLFVYFHLFIIVLLEFQAFCVHMCIYIHNICKMDMKIDIKFNFSFKFRLNTILEEKKRESKKREKLMPFPFGRLFSLILIVYSFSPLYLPL